ncbi:hypothetical protein LTR94_030400, partial [Friedmanniomyces endolithicus]
RGLLVWSDEFDVPGAPAPQNWTYDTHANASGWYNEEAQYYAADRLENARIEDGVLIIEARRETLKPEPADWGGQDYTSARLISTAGWRGGFVETRAKLPCGRGSWPAIWMLPQSPSGWPIGGEIDIMEIIGKEPANAYGTLHGPGYSGEHANSRASALEGAEYGDDFHVFAVEWEPQQIRWYRDGIHYHTAMSVIVM